MKQGTQEWLDARLGKITASRFGDVMTKPRSKKDREEGKLSKTAESYVKELITEVLTGESRSLENIALDWGTEQEYYARQTYELHTLTEVIEEGFIEHPKHPVVGGSPDGLIGEDGGIEIKCPFNSTYHVAYLMGESVPRSYFAQIQGNMWINNRKWWDFVSFDPRMKHESNKLYIRRFERDDEFIGELERLIGVFLKHYKLMLEPFMTNITFDLIDRNLEVFNRLSKL